MRSEWFNGDCVVEAEADEEDGLTLQSFGGVLVMYGAFVGLAIAVRVLMIIRVRLYGAAVGVVRRNTNRGGGGPLEADRSESSLSLDAVSAATPRVAMLTNLFQRIVPDQAPARKNLSALDHPLQRKNTVPRSI
ncbi:hypothetical protein DIPPA_26180 [Diplonema papillatum]|nr:hypothetical protein DIPPA_26180 [Diplonema papillatum]